MYTLPKLIIEKEGKRPIVADFRCLRNGFSKPLVIFVHGFKGFKDWGTFNAVADELAAAGLAVLKFNFSHNGGTVEQPIDFPDLEAFGHNNYSLEQEDLQRVIDYACADDNLPGEEVDTETIYLIGHSKGGGASILTAANDRRISKLVSWAAVADFAVRLFRKPLEEWKEKGVLFVPNGRTKQDMPMYYQIVEDLQKNAEALSIPDAATRVEVPWLIVHGKEDEAVPYDDALSLKGWSKRAYLHSVAGAGHTFGGKHPWTDAALPVHLQSVMAATIPFLKA